MHSNRLAKQGESRLWSGFEDISANLATNLSSAELASQTNMVGKAKAKVEQIEEQLHHAR